MSKGFKGLPPNLSGIMKKAQQMQEQLQKIKEEASSYVGEGSAGGGMVKVTANSNHELLTVRISAELLSGGDVEMLQDLVLAASNEALKKADAVLQDKMSEITGGSDLQGML